MLDEVAAPIVDGEPLGGGREIQRSIGRGHHVGGEPERTVVDRVDQHRRTPAAAFQVQHSAVVIAEDNRAVGQCLEAQEMTRGVGEHLDVLVAGADGDQPTVVESGDDPAVGQAHHILGAVTRQGDTSEFSHAPFIPIKRGLRLRRWSRSRK